MAFLGFLPQFGPLRGRKCRDLDPNRPDPIADAPSAVPLAGSIIASCARDSTKASRAWRSCSTWYWWRFPIRTASAFTPMLVWGELLDIRFPHELEGARRELVARDLIAYEDGIYQVLDLPAGSPRKPREGSPQPPDQAWRSTTSRPRLRKNAVRDAAADLESIQQVLERCGWGRT